MRNVRLTSAFIIAFTVLACSDDDSGDGAVTTTNPNQPGAAGSGGAAGAAGSAGSAGSSASAAGNGGSSSETPDDDIDLDPPADDTDGSGDGDVADASAPPATPADAGAGDDDSDSDSDEEDTSLSFFVTSRGGADGANFGGLEGADALCTTLAAAVSPELGAKTWAAYLSTTTVNARDRIGSGPWFNAAGVLVATDVEQLTDPAALEATWATGDASIALDELGNEVPAGGAGGVQHDILTGTLADGTVAPDLTCGDWTLTTGNVQIGHSNRQGGGADPTSWSSAHGAPAGCAPAGTPGPNVASGGGRGSIYCFEVN